MLWFHYVYGYNSPKATVFFIGNYIFDLKGENNDKKHFDQIFLIRARGGYELKRGVD